MPFVDRNGAPLAPETMTAQVPYGVGDDAPQQTSSFLATGAAQLRSTTLGSAFADSRGFIRPDVDPNFNAWKAIEGTPYEAHFDKFLDARNAADSDAIKANIDRENQDRDTLSRSSWFSFLTTGVASQLLDPLNYIGPAGGPIRTAEGGIAIARTALMAGASNMAVAGIQEAFLHASQETRTIDETTWNILGAGIAGTILGGTFAKLMPHGEMQALGGKLMDDMHAGPIGNPDAEAVNSAVQALRQHQAITASAGAAAVPTPSLKDLDVSGAISRGVVNAAKFSPKARAFSRQSPQARYTLFRLAGVDVHLTGGEEGKTLGPPVQNLVRQWEGQYDMAAEGHLTAYKDYVRRGGNAPREQFNEMVAGALRRNDEHAVPEVVRAAQTWRSQVIEPGTQAAQKAGLLPDDLQVTTAPSYFTRVWDRKRIQAEEKEFKDAVRAYYGSVIDKDKFDSPAEHASHVDDIANNVFDKITGRGGSMADDFTRITVSARGPLKERTFNMPDELVERWLDNDVERVMTRFSRVLGADVELANAFPESVDVGSKRVTLDGPIKKVKEDYNRLRSEVMADAKLTPDQRAKKLLALSKDEKGATDDIASVRDELRGTLANRLDGNAPFSRALKVANTFNYIRSGGGFVPSSFTDIARPMMTAGTARYFLDGLVKFATNSHFRAIARKEGRFAGTITETAKYARMASMTEMTDPYAKGAMLERFTSQANRMMTRASGIALWNDYMKTFSSAIVENRLVKNIMTDWDSLRELDRRYMAYVGIDRDMSERMRGQITRAAEDGEDAGRVGDFWHSGTDSWKDDWAKRTFWAAIDHDVSSTIVTPGAGDLPTWMHSALGKNVLQYKSFVIASHQKALVRAMQEGANGSQVAVLMGVMSAISIGMFVSYLKAVEGNRLDQLSDNPGAWLAEGVDRSGMLSVLMEASATSEVLRGPGNDKYPTGIYSGLQALFPEADQKSGPSRFASRGVLGQLLGPTAGTVEDMARIWGWTSDPNRRPVGAKAALTLLPGRTLPYIRPILEYGVKPQLDEGQQ